MLTFDNRPTASSKMSNNRAHVVDVKSQAITITVLVCSNILPQLHFYA